jgi:hypothetical protein
MAQHEAVVFGLPQPDGSIKQVSNDPYWQAEQLLAGQQDKESTGDELERLRAENEALKAAAGQTPPALPESVTVADDDNEEDDTEDEFASLNGKELKKRASDLGVDITGLRKVGEVRQALRDRVAQG